MKLYHIILCCFSCILSCKAFNVFGPGKSLLGNTAYTPPPSKVSTCSWLDTLKYEGTPTFDVLAKTIEFAECTSFEEIEQFFDEEYLFRGPIFGPLTADDVRKTQQGFRVQDAFPNLQTRPFGFTVDPDNPYRCYYFERWEGTNTASVKIGGTEIPPTNADAKLPTHIMSLNWTPEGKIKYACLSSPLDRFEGTTKGAGAVLGLLVAVGVDPGNASVGDLFLRLQQRFLNSIEGFGRNWSVEADIPDWWKSKARGADPNDM
mmetsp:Transcript_1393/g.1866  ORF Transcript_1393/g.1866 Transcript_1393/m.1866 type:complete len:261 (+) Transcript_1393:166-948(+)|eukprot:CAMPEP_0178933876 /NCGR_PEP_ID=MMETSP0786-20121207/23543_1 /TAXON_ID=186022 /ORGANISM="Thalassionema frauenfeldii, Strain CCMP 1798" /LENGTH=260 /DNA_ID=CAMNT_0020611581 /DNA_START=141 /DNA_END=923 /DNA_ORIENTATION=+